MVGGICDREESRKTEAHTRSLMEKLQEDLTQVRNTCSLMEKETVRAL